MREQREQRSYDNHECRLTVTRYGRNLLLFTVAGRLSAAKAKQMIEVAQELLDRHGQIHVFHDWEGVGSYEPGAKLELTKFVLVNRSHFASAHLLVTAPDVAFGVEVANIVLKNKIVVHGQRERFEAALQRALES